MSLTPPPSLSRRRSHSEANDSHHYKHAPLIEPDKHIRLLTLLPGDSRKTKKPLRGTIRHVSLASKPPYLALSYSWGKNSKHCLFEIVDDLTPDEVKEDDPVPIEPRQAPEAESSDASPSEEVVAEIKLPEAKVPDAKADVLDNESSSNGNDDNNNKNNNNNNVSSSPKLSPKRFLITDSLQEALYHLQHPTESLTLWIDQICINQTSPCEKSAQVRIMKPIYESANEVLIWLGPSNQNSTTALDQLARVGQSVVDENQKDADITPVHGKQTPTISATTVLPAQDYLRLIVDQRVLPSDPPLYRLLAKLREFDVDKQAITQLYTRKWWKRVWVIQEFLSCRKTTFACGAARANADLVVAGVSLLQIARRGMSIWKQRGVERERLVEAGLGKLPGYENSIMVMTELRRMWVKGERWSLDELLIMCWRGCFKATDSRDFIFGLGGLLGEGGWAVGHAEGGGPVDGDGNGSGDGQDEEPAPAVKIKPDYSMTEVEAYTEATVALLKAGYHALLSEAQWRHFHNNGPSWVPDYKAGILARGDTKAYRSSSTLAASFKVTTITIPVSPAEINDRDGKRRKRKSRAGKGNNNLSVNNNNKDDDDESDYISSTSTNNLNIIHNPPSPSNPPPTPTHITKYLAHFTGIPLSKVAGILPPFPPPKHRMVDTWITQNAKRAARKAYDAAPENYGGTVEEGRFIGVGGAEKAIYKATVCAAYRVLTDGEHAKRSMPTGREIEAVVGAGGKVEGSGSNKAGRGRRGGIVSAPSTGEGGVGKYNGVSRDEGGKPGGTTAGASAGEDAGATANKLPNKEKLIITNEMEEKVKWWMDVGFYSSGRIIHQQVFWTEDGWIGVGFGVGVGDQVVMLDGFSKPVLLKRTGWDRGGGGGGRGRGGVSGQGGRGGGSDGRGSHRGKRDGKRQGGKEREWKDGDGDVDASGWGSGNGDQNGDDRKNGNGAVSEDGDREGKEKRWSFGRTCMFVVPEGKSIIPKDTKKEVFVVE